MKALTWLLLALAALVLVAFPLFARPGCGPGGCWGAPPSPPVGGPAAPLAPATFPDAKSFEWKAYPENPSQVFLLFGGRTAGAWDYDGRYYRPYNGRAWGEPRGYAPVPPPEREAPPKAAEQVGQNFGIDVDKVGREKGTRYWRKGEEVSRADVVAALERGDLKDDSKHLRLTIAGGTDADRKRVLDDYRASAELAELRGRVNVWACAADHFSLKDTDTGAMLFPASPARVMVCLQAADGTVLHRQDGYDGPADFQAVRKASGYDPARDRDLRKPDLAAPLASVPPAVWALGVLVGAFVLAGVFQNKK
jgi:hypothetical protein